MCFHLRRGAQGSDLGCPDLEIIFEIAAARVVLSEKMEHTKHSRTSHIVREGGAREGWMHMLFPTTYAMHIREGNKMQHQRDTRLHQEQHNQEQQQAAGM
jgi:hypothetical protein